MWDMIFTRGGFGTRVDDVDPISNNPFEVLQVLQQSSAINVRNHQPSKLSGQRDGAHKLDVKERAGFSTMHCGTYQSSQWLAANAPAVAFKKRDRVRLAFVLVEIRSSW